MKGWLFLVIAIVGEVIATSALKSSEGFTKLAYAFLSRLVQQASHYARHQNHSHQPNRYSFVIAPERDEIRDRC